MAGRNVLQRDTTYFDTLSTFQSLYFVEVESVFYLNQSLYLHKYLYIYLSKECNKLFLFWKWGFGPVMQDAELKVKLKLKYIADFFFFFFFLDEAVSDWSRAGGATFP